MDIVRFYEETKKEMNGNDINKINNYENIVKYILKFENWNKNSVDLQRTITCLDNLWLEWDVLDVCKLHRYIVINSLENSQ